MSPPSTAAPFRFELRTATEEQLRVAREAAGLDFRPAEAEIRSIRRLAPKMRAAAPREGARWAERWRRWAAHPDERVVAALIEARLEYKPLGVQAEELWERFEREAQAEGVLWTPLMDRLVVASMTEDELLFILSTGQEQDFLRQRDVWLRRLDRWAETQTRLEDVAPAARFESVLPLHAVARLSPVRGEGLFRLCEPFGPAGLWAPWARNHYVSDEDVQLLARATVRGLEAEETDEGIQALQAMLRGLWEATLRSPSLPPDAWDALHERLSAARDTSWDLRLGRDIGTLLAHAALSAEQAETLWATLVRLGPTVTTQQGDKHALQSFLLRNADTPDTVFEQAVARYPGVFGVQRALAENDRALQNPVVRKALHQTRDERILSRLCADAEPRHFRTFLKRLLGHETPTAAAVLGAASDAQIEALTEADLHSLLLAPRAEVRLAALRIAARHQAGRGEKPKRAPARAATDRPRKAR
jgi:hypothetical protein